MAKSRNYLRLFATLLVIVTTARSVISIDTATIPVDKSRLNMWFEENVKPVVDRQGQLDRVLAAAESQPPHVIKVSKDGSSGQFRTITEAVKSIPDGNKQRVIISIGPGVYYEKIKIPRTKPFVTFYGQISGGSILPNLTYDGTAAKYGTVESATLIVESDYFMAVNLNIVNSAPKPTQNTKMPQALAMRIMGNRAAFYNCRFFGFQDTLMDDRGYHFFKNCYVEGTVDFIFGKGTSLYLDSELHVIGDGGYRVIAAQDRSQEAEKNGYSFVHCKITGSGTGTYLGRAWRSHAKVVYSYTYMSSVVHPEGWNLRNNPKLEKTVFYGEYKCFGPGSGQAQRVDYAEDIDDKEAVGFLTLGYVRGSQWLLPPPRV